MIESKSLLRINLNSVNVSSEIHTHVSWYKHSSSTIVTLGSDSSPSQAESELRGLELQPGSASCEPGTAYPYPNTVNQLRLAVPAAPWAQQHAMAFSTEKQQLSPNYATNIEDSAQRSLQSMGLQRMRPVRATAQFWPTWF